MTVACSKRVPCRESRIQGFFSAGIGTHKLFRRPAWTGDRADIEQASSLYGFCDFRCFSENMLGSAGVLHDRTEPGSVLQTWFGESMQRLHSEEFEAR